MLDQARSKLRTADALVLMPYVRTNLGRHLRAGAGEAGLPWVPCTAKGRDSLLGAVERAVGVVLALRAGRANPAGS